MPRRPEPRHHPREPGGIWMIVMGLPTAQVEAVLAQVRQQNPNQSITMLIDPQQKAAVTAVDEVWVFDRLGPSGLLALLRRASWRHFEQVYQFRDPVGKVRHGWLKWLVWPRPNWRILSSAEMSGLDLRAR